ncbi:MAG: glycosyltransferase family 1 protein [Deltaproteobacteria bacterium]|nr:glycosyltransferase family 1 protein [Deltaproteobacteria bacterium]
MKIVLVTSGSLGDVQPMLALTLGLKEAGHEALLAGPPEKAGWARTLGCPYRPFGRDFTAFLDGMRDAHTIRPSLSFLAFVHREVEAQFDSLPEIISGADLAVGSSLAFALSHVAESMGIAYRYIAFTPQLLPSAHHPSPLFRRQGLPGWSNRATWRLTRSIDRLLLARFINDRRSRLGLRPIGDVWALILGKRPIVATDVSIAIVPPDASPPGTQTGYMHLQQPEQDLPELEAFLGVGPPPVYAGFGSMPKKDQEENVPRILEALRSLGQRAVIARFWDESARPADSDDVFLIRRYPHLRLFPRMAAVVHHGGAGTTASSAISGAPQVIVPHALDQYFWGGRVHRAGLGPKPLWRSRLTADRLASAIQECLSNPRIRQRAVAVAKEIASRDGLEMTVREVVRDPG